MKFIYFNIISLCIYIIFMCLECVLSNAIIEMAVFLLKMHSMHSKWKILEKIVLCDSNLVIIDTKKKIIFHTEFYIL